MHQLIDSHCHWDHPRLQSLQPHLWQSCLDQGVTQLVVPATKESSFARTIPKLALSPGSSSLL